MKMMKNNEVYEFSEMPEHYDILLVLYTCSFCFCKQYRQQHFFLVNNSCFTFLPWFYRLCKLATIPIAWMPKVHNGMPYITCVNFGMYYTFEFIVHVLRQTYRSFKQPCSQALVQERRRQSLVHISCMHQVSLVTCILLCYIKINRNFCLHAETH